MTKQQFLVHCVDLFIIALHSSTLHLEPIRSDLLCGIQAVRDLLSETNAKQLAWDM